MENKQIIPKRVQLETYYGCNARCVMCAVSLPPTRKKGIMDDFIFKKTIDELSPYTDKIEKLDLFGLGEPLLDSKIFERIRYAKQKGFKSISISTNADLLNEEKQKRLLDSGIDAVLLSIDGVKKETHESIRRGVTFERVVDNINSLIKMRNLGGYHTRFVVRFIKQKINKDEWDEFKKYWQSRISKDKGDIIIMYDVNTMGGEVFSKKDIIAEENPEIEKKPCAMVFERLIILNDGTVPLCCEDTPKAVYNMGNVKDKNPLEIFNSDKFNNMRRLHSEGNKTKIDICKNCTVLYSEDKQRRY